MLSNNLACSTSLNIKSSHTEQRKTYSIASKPTASISQTIMGTLTAEQSIVNRIAIMLDFQ